MVRFLLWKPQICSVRAGWGAWIILECVGWGHARHQWYSREDTGDHSEDHDQDKMVKGLDIIPREVQGTRNLYFGEYLGWALFKCLKGYHEEEEGNLFYFIQEDRGRNRVWKIQRANLELAVFAYIHFIQQVLDSLLLIHYNLNSQLTNHKKCIPLIVSGLNSKQRRIIEMAE